MARRSRYRGGGPYRGIYKPRTAADLARKKARPPAAKKRAAGYARPGSKTADRQAQRILGALSKWPAEALHLRNAALAETLGRSGYEGSNALWREYIGEKQRGAYNRQQASRRAARPRTPRPRSSWVRVKAHRRQRPGRRA